MNSPRARSRFASRSRMRSNAARQLRELVGAVIDDRLAEVAVGDPLGRLLEPPDPPREQRSRRRNRSRIANAHRDRAGDEDAPADDRDGLQLVVERRREQTTEPPTG